jgi:hypothetical protein
VRADDNVYSPVLQIINRFALLLRGAEAAQFGDVNLLIFQKTFELHLHELD